jgi:hypothetical protein
MTIAAILLLASLLTIGIFRKFRESKEEIPAEQVNESTVNTEEIPEPLPEPQAEIIENPPHQAEKKVGKADQKKSSPAKKTPAKKSPAKSAPAKKTTPKK